MLDQISKTKNNQVMGSPSPLNSVAIALISLLCLASLALASWYAYAQTVKPESVKTEPEEELIQNPETPAETRPTNPLISLPGTQSPGEPSSTPEPTAFVSAGRKLLENNIYGQILEAEEIGPQIKIKVQLANQSQTSQKIAPIRLQMRSMSENVAPTPAYLDITLLPGASTVLELNYEKLKTSPVTWFYITNIGGSISLGSYSK